MRRDEDDLWREWAMVGLDWMGRDGSFFSGGYLHGERVGCWFVLSILHFD
jgi:hypothetical protein